MKFIITRRVNCGVGIPDGKSLSIGEFVFLPDFEGEHYARHIQVSVDASTKEEAIYKAGKLFFDFMAKLSLIDNSKYALSNDMSVKPDKSSITTTTVSIMARASIVSDGNQIKSVYEKAIMKKRLRKKPIRIYAEALNSIQTFEQYRNFYRVLECYGSSKDITVWVKKHIKKQPMKKDKYGNDITVFTWIRHKLSHSKNGKNGLEPFLFSDPTHVAIVNKYLPELQKLVREKIMEEEKLRL